MPYRPEELIARRPIDVDAEVKALSERIDEEMLKNYRGGVFCSSVGPCPEPMLIALRDLYREYGWHVSWKQVVELRGWLLTFEPLRADATLKWKAAR